jgi:hypothetical protein
MLTGCLLRLGCGQSLLDKDVKCYTDTIHSRSRSNSLEQSRRILVCRSTGMNSVHFPPCQ